MTTELSRSGKTSEEILQQRRDSAALPQTEPLKKPKVGSKGFPRAGGGKIPKRKARPNQKTTQKKTRSAKFLRKIQKICKKLENNPRKTQTQSQPFVDLKT